MSPVVRGYDGDPDLTVTATYTFTLIPVVFKVYYDALTYDIQGKQFRSTVWPSVDSKKNWFCTEEKRNSDNNNPGRLV